MKEKQFDSTSKQLGILSTFVLSNAPGFQSSFNQTFTDITIVYVQELLLYFRD